MKTVASYTLFFQDSDIELSQEFDEEDTPDEEDNEKETSEKDIFIELFTLKNWVINYSNNSIENNYYFHSNVYSPPILDAIFCPPDSLI